MATSISNGERNFGFQAGVIHGNIGNVTFVQSDTLDQACLRDLRTTNPVDDKKRIEDTKGGLLEDSYRWILGNKEFRQWQDSQSNRLLWIKSDPGKGKTMLLCGIIDELTRLYGINANISFFFCQAIDMRINSATSVLRGLVYLLVQKNPSLLPHVRARYDHAGKTLFEDVNAWNALSAIFRDILNDPTLQMTYLVIDALDECTFGLRSLLDLIVKESSVNVQIKWVVSSRNWPEITERLDIATQLAPISLELNEASVSEAVNRFIRHKVNHLAKTKKYSNTTRDAVQCYLLSNSQGTFLWVALVCQNLERIRINVLKKLESFPPGLDALYGQMIHQVLSLEDAELCKEILAVILIVYRPITFEELASFINMPDDLGDCEVLSEIIASCGSFLSLRGRIISLVHQSAKEFLLQVQSHEIFPNGVEKVHYSIFSKSLQAMSGTLKRDIYSLQHPGISIDDLKIQVPDPLAPIRYSCVHWVDHLCYAPHQDNLVDGGPTFQFLQEFLLNWLEALSFSGCISEGILAITRMESLLTAKSDKFGLPDLVRDARRFCLHNRWVIENAPLQIYASALIFTPRNSWVHQQFRNSRPSWLERASNVRDEWSRCEQTFEGHRDSVNTVAFSPDGRFLASASNDRTVRLWDAETGAYQRSLEGHLGHIRALAFSPVGQFLASASNDRTVRLWDAETGVHQRSLEGHLGPINTVAFSPTGQLLASASNDRTVRLWDAETGAYHRSLEGHLGSVNAVVFSSDGRLVASASNDRTVRLWDAETGVHQRSLEGHRSEVKAVAFSPDGRLIASASNDRTVRLWDAETGVHQRSLEGHLGPINTVAFSPTGQLLASASNDRTVRLWDAETGAYHRSLEGHLGPINAVIFSPDGRQLASASKDGMLRLWDISTSRDDQKLVGHSGAINGLAISPDGRWLASASKDRTVRIWNTKTGVCQIVLEGHSSEIYTVAFSPDGQRLASTSKDETVRIWDAETGVCQLTLEGHLSGVYTVAFSSDGQRIASASNDETVRVWDTEMGDCQLTLEGHDASIYAVGFSPDGQRLASASKDQTVRLWNAATGECLQRLHANTATTELSLPEDRRLLETVQDQSVLDSVQLDINSSRSTRIISVNAIDELAQYSRRPLSRILVKEEWISRDGQNILWLPPDYRPACSASFGNLLILGHASGHITFLEFAS